MNCKEFEEIKNRYLVGETTAEQENKIEEHLDQCTICQASLDQCLTEENGYLPPRARLDKLKPDNLLDTKQQQRILRLAKYKNRFSIAIFLLLLFIGLNVVGTLLSSYYYNSGGEKSRLYTIQKTASLLIESAFPNVTMPLNINPYPAGFSRAGWGHSSLEIKPYFAAAGTYALEKQIGREKYTVGYLKLNSILSSPIPSWEWENNSFNNYLYFYHPVQLAYTNLADNSQDVWDALKILPEGTVAEMSGSFSQTYSFNEIRELLSEYDLEITWYAVCTGVEGKVPEHRLQDPLTAFHGVWGFPQLSKNMINEHKEVSSEDSALRTEYLIESLEFLLQNEELTRDLYRGDPDELQLKERLQYIEKNGVQIYGIVVTGPAKELLKLSNLDTFRCPGLGEVRLWNWFERNFEGQLY